MDITQETWDKIKGRAEQVDVNNYLHYSADIEFIKRSVLEHLEINISRRDACNFWVKYSDSYCAGWMSMDDYTSQRMSQDFYFYASNLEPSSDDNWWDQ